MIIYNITFHVENKAIDDCILFLKETYIPAALKDEVLLHPQLCKVLGDTDGESSSYALQFHVEDIEQLNDWWKKHGEELNSLLVRRFADKVVGFTTLLEKIDHQI